MVTKQDIKLMVGIATLFFISGVLSTLAYLPKPTIIVDVPTNNIKITNYKQKQYYVYQQANVAIPNTFKESYIDTILYYDNLYEVPDSISFRIINHESRFREDVVEGRKLGSLGEIGMFQILPSTIKFLYTTLNLKPSIYSQIHSAIYYLRLLYENDFNWEHALSRYGCGKVKHDSEFVNYVFKRKQL